MVTLFWLTECIMFLKMNARKAVKYVLIAGVTFWVCRKVYINHINPHTPKDVCNISQDSCCMYASCSCNHTSTNYYTTNMHILLCVVPLKFTQILLLHSRNSIYQMKHRLKNENYQSRANCEKKLTKVLQKGIFDNKGNKYRIMLLVGDKNCGKTLLSMKVITQLHETGLYHTYRGQIKYIPLRFDIDTTKFRKTHTEELTTHIVSQLPNNNLKMPRFTTQYLPLCNKSQTVVI